MSISYEISLTEEQFSDCTTVDSKEKDLLLSRKNSKFPNFFPISNNSFVIRAETKNYRTLYQEKCKSLENLEKEFNKLHESVSSLIENAKNVNNNYTSQISHLKDLVVFILDEYNNQNNQSIDYIINFIQNNNTIFQKILTVLRKKPSFFLLQVLPLTSRFSFSLNTTTFLLRIFQKYQYSPL